MVGMRGKRTIGYAVPRILTDKSGYGIMGLTFRHPLPQNSLNCSADPSQLTAIGMIPERQCRVRVSACSTSVFNTRTYRAGCTRVQHAAIPFNTRRVQHDENLTGGRQ